MDGIDGGAVCEAGAARSGAPRVNGVPRVLVVDDEKNIRRTVAMVLESEGCAVEDAATAEAALERLGEGGIDVVLLDVKLPGMSGMEALRHIVGRESFVGRGERGDRARGGEAAVVMISGHATIDDAVRATRLGAFDFLEKPLDRERVVLSVRNALERAALGREVRSLRATVGRGEMLGVSAAMTALRAQVAKVAPTRGRVLITGESGTGKELVAWAIHLGSNSLNGEFVKINCAAIAPDLIESELFGHERGAFTGAIEKKVGLFELADGGTLLLDEVGDLALPAQAKLLRVLETGELTRVGGERTLRSNARVIAATNQDLERAVAAGAFREDLYFRLNVLRLHTPPLRERREDIALLASTFLARCCRDNGLGDKTVAADALGVLLAWRWPGNVRELRNVIEQAAILGGTVITATDLPDDLRALRPRAALEGAEGKTLREFRDHMEREFIRLRLDELGWNVSRTAEALGIDRANLHKRLRAWGMARED